jgi:DNA invertase Pin-like site-specific DNA recombinase
MTKITAEHLSRSAVVYVRQSTAYQVANNLESQRRQYGLTGRARQLGWSDVEVIDDDLGRSGGGTARPGFEKLLAAICEGRVGAVLSIEASRLARNGRDWHTLLEFCGLVSTLIIDEDGVYDPRSPNDRLLLGMKGTMSEMELSVFRQRSAEAMKQKASRGELFLTVAVGYIKTEDDRIEVDPDQRVQDAVRLVFSKFAELQTVRQVLLWMRQEQIFPAGHGHKWRQAARRMEATWLPHSPSHPDKSRLCWRLRLRPPWSAYQDRRRTETDYPQSAPRSKGLAGFAQGTSCRVYYLGRIREESEAHHR